MSAAWEDSLSRREILAVLGVELAVLPLAIMTKLRARISKAITLMVFSCRCVASGV